MSPLMRTLLFGVDVPLVLLDLVAGHPAAVIMHPSLVDLLHVAAAEDGIFLQLRVTEQIAFPLFLDDLQEMLELFKRR